MGVCHTAVLLVGDDIDLSADSLDDEVLSLKDKFNNIFPELSASIYLETEVW